MAIGEVLIGALITLLIEKLASGELKKFMRSVGIDAQRIDWSEKLSIVKAVHTDAENKHTEGSAVEKWLKNLEDLAKDLEDVVDKLITEASLRKIRENHEANRPSTSMVRKLIPSCCTNFSFHGFMSDREMDSKMKEISGRLEELIKQISILRLVERPYRTTERLQLTSVVEESEVYGREKDKENILNMLLRVESMDGPISVIPIVGMGGVGKTTLAQLVYNDDRLKDEFDLKAWACVSDQFDALMVTKSILKQVSPGRYDDDDFNTLQVKLKQNLSNKKFLLVLDDVWNDNYEDWDILNRPFLAGKPGSKIIVTTRQYLVAKTMSLSPTYGLDLLSGTDALSLLAHHALGAKTFDARPDLRDIGMAVVKRCKNLPLAVKALGGLLRTMVSPKEWEDVLNSEIWLEEKCNILPSLKLSYQYLCPPLKTCFAYCALFPKDYEFDKSTLVYLWIAEGFLQVSQREMLTQVGSRYFDELLARSFFQQSSANASYFVMHDLLNDLAKFVAGDKCLRVDDEFKENLPSNISESFRHLSFIRHDYEMYQRFNFVKEVRSLRTFLPLPIRSYKGFFSQRVLLDILPKLHCLRVLSLNSYSIYELPNSIGDLKLLRYLDVSETLLKCLPESVSNLINLQVLILRGCSRLTKLPASMENLINLFYLDIASTEKLNEMPQGMAQLTSLQILSKMIVSKSCGMRLKDLGNLSRLQDEISILNLQNVVNVQEAIDARLMYNPRLTKVRLAWSNKFGDSRNKILDFDVLNALKPHYNLSSLEIEFYGGSNFSNWIGDSSFRMLEKISFNFCRKCMTFPSLGQLPCLRELSIRGMDQVKVLGVEFYGDKDCRELPFPVLERLTFEDMPDWEEWLGLTHEVEGFVRFPKLSKLYIRQCPKLVKFPILSLPSLCELEAEACNEVVLSHMRNLESLTLLKLKKIFGLTSVSKAFMPFPFALEKLEVRDCSELETLWPRDSIAQSLVNLRRLSVRNCPKLLSLRDIDTLPVLRNLEIWDCGSLEFVPDSIYCLKRLEIGDCPSLKTMMKLQDCNTSLDLSVKSVVNLKLTNLLGSVHNYTSLCSLVIDSCDGLELFPPEGLPVPNLKYLDIIGCQHLKSLPDRMDLLSSLEYLFVQFCPLLVEPFPQGKFPPNLRGLSIYDCGKLNPLGEWGLHKITSLEAFSLGADYPELVSFSNDDDDEDDHHYLLPPSIMSLRLCDMLNLESLSKGFQNLTSLRHLNISDCPKLVALPMEDQLDRIRSLNISNCPLLKKRCLKDKGDYWPIIAEIPNIKIDGCSVHDPDQIIC